MKVKCLLTCISLVNIVILKSENGKYLNRALQLFVIIYENSLDESYIANGVVY